MRFWGSSAIVSLLVAEQDSDQRKRQYVEDPTMLVWYGTRVEIESALSRRIRAGELGREVEAEARARLKLLADAWFEVQPADRVRERALRLLRVHPLRAADSLQLAAALVACEERPAGFAFLTGDTRLAEAAEREGFLLH